jgi:hypothetical protein
MSGAPARTRRRGCGEGSTYKDEAKGRWYADVSTGCGPDGKTWCGQEVSARTRAEVAVKLRELRRIDPGDVDTTAEPGLSLIARRSNSGKLTVRIIYDAAAIDQGFVSALAARLTACPRALADPRDQAR